MCYFAKINHEDFTQPDSLLAMLFLSISEFREMLLQVYKMRTRIRSFNQVCKQFVLRRSFSLKHCIFHIYTQNRKISSEFFHSPSLRKNFYGQFRWSCKSHQLHEVKDQL